MEKFYHINNLDCASCASKIENKLKKIKSIDEVIISFMTKKVFIESNKEIDIKILNEAIKMIDSDLEIEEI